MSKWLDPAFFDHRTPGVVLLPAIKSQDLHSAMQASLALVNTSLSEGMAESILEVHKVATK